MKDNIIKINESTIRKIVAESLSGINAKPVTPSEDKGYVEDGTGSLIRIRDIKDFMYKYEQEKKSGKQTPPLWDWWYGRYKAFFDKYSSQLRENKQTMKKNTINLNEAQLKKIVAESVKKVIKEYVEGEQGGTDVYKCVPDTYVDYYLKANKYGDYNVLAGNKLNSIYPGKIIAVSTPEEAQQLSKIYGQCILKITASTEGVSQGRNCVLVEPDSVLNIERIA